jgi:hypothetical protein
MVGAKMKMRNSITLDGVNFSVEYDTGLANHAPIALIINDAGRELGLRPRKSAAIYMAHQILKLTGEG